MGLLPLAVHPQDLFVGQQAQGELVVLPHLPAHHQGGAEHAPQAHHGDLLVFRKLGPVAALLIPQGALIVSQVQADAPQGQHVAVRPAAGRDLALPHLTALEHIFQQVPPVPEVVGDPPHVGVFAQVPGLFDHRRAGGQAEHHGPAALVDGLADHLDFLLRGVGGVGVGVGVADVVHLDEVHPPGGVQLEDGVVIGLGPGLRGVDAVHVRVPPADGVGRGNLVAGGVRPQHRQVLVHRQPGHPPHDVDAELQAQVVDLLGDGAKTLALPGGGEPLRGGEESAVLVHGKPGEGHVVGALLPGVGLAPLDVADHVLPAELL